MTPGPGAGAWPLPGSGSPQRSSPTLPTPRRRAQDGVGMGKVGRARYTADGGQKKAAVTMTRYRRENIAHVPYSAKTSGAPRGRAHGGMGSNPYLCLVFSLLEK